MPYTKVRIRHFIRTLLLYELYWQEPLISSIPATESSHKTFNPIQAILLFHFHHQAIAAPRLV